MIPEEVLRYPLHSYGVKNLLTGYLCIFKDNIPATCSG